MADNDEKSIVDFIAGLFVLYIGFLILKWLWNSPLMRETDGYAMRVFKIIGLLWLLTWIIFR